MASGKTRFFAGANRVKIFTELDERRLEKLGPIRLTMLPNPKARSTP